MFIGRTPGKKRADRRARQQQYARDLDAQVTLRANQKVEELAKLHAERYTKEFGLADQLASKPGSGFGGPGAGLSPRFGPPRVGIGQPRASQRMQVYGEAQQLNESIVGDLEQRFRNVTKAFLAADVNRSGSLDVAELRRLCSMYNLPTAQVEAAFALSDIDGNGYISYNEFAKKLARVDYTRTSMPLPGAPGYKSAGNQFPRKPGMGGLSRRIVNPALESRHGNNDVQVGGNMMNNFTGNAATYTGSLKNMWQGRQPGIEEIREKKAQQNAYVSVLESQIAERKARELKAKQLEKEDEARAEAEAKRYNPWGRGGAGAPLQDETGKPITDLRDLHHAGKVGGLSPKQGGRQGSSESFRTQSVQRQGEASLYMYGSPTNLRGAVASSANHLRGEGQLMKSLGRFQMANAPPEVRDEYLSRMTKQEALKSDLAKQMEEKKRRKMLEKQRKLELERREDERVRREQEEIRTQYMIEHRAQQKKEQDLAEANRLAAEESKARAEAARKNAAEVMAMPNPKRDDAFSPKRSAMRTPPPAGGYPQITKSSSDGGGPTNSGSRREGSMTRLRRDLNDQHGALLRELNIQRETVMELRSQIEMFAKGGAVGQNGNSNYYGVKRSGRDDVNSNYGGLHQQQNWAGGLHNQSSDKGTGNGFMQSIDMDDPDELDNLLLDFVNKRNAYNPASRMPSL